MGVVAKDPILIRIEREGTNALDAAFLAYSSVSLLRQQIKPDQRIHGIIQGKDWSPNGEIESTIRGLLRFPTSWL
jgi:hypothetical protein